MEERVGARLLNRTTRSVGLTEAGRCLHERILPLLQMIEDALTEAGEDGIPSGPLRITAPAVAGKLVLGPGLAAFVAKYPRIQLEIVLEDGLVDIVDKGYDAGIRLDETLDRDMVGVRLSAPFKYAAVAAPAYLDRQGTPQGPSDLLHHLTIGFRFPTSGRLYRWEFERGADHVLHAPLGALVLNDSDMTVCAALDGLGIAYVPRPLVEPQLASGALIELLADWSAETPGLFLYYSSRRLLRPALRAFCDHFRVASGSQLASSRM